MAADCPLPPPQQLTPQLSKQLDPWGVRQWTPPLAGTARWGRSHSPQPPPPPQARQAQAATPATLEKRAWPGHSRRARSAAGHVCRTARGEGQRSASTQNSDEPAAPRYIARGWAHLVCSSEGLAGREGGSEGLRGRRPGRGALSSRGRLSKAPRGGRISCANPAGWVHLAGSRAHRMGQCHGAWASAHLG